MGSSIEGSAQTVVVQRASVFVAVAIGVAVTDSSAFAQTACTYSGPATGNYSAAVNWSCGTVPINNGSNTYNAIIPGGKTVTFDIAIPVGVSGFNPQSGSQFNISAGRHYIVESIGTIAGFLNVAGAGSTFSSVSPLSTLQDNARATVNAGGVVEIGPINAGALQYHWTNGTAGATLFSVDGIGSRLDLSSLGSFSAATSLIGGPYYYAVMASNGGVIDLSHVTTLIGAAGDEWLQLRVTSGGSIDLSALTTATNRVFFDPEVPTFSLPALQIANGAWMQVSASNMINAPALTTLDNGTLDIADGGTVNAPLLRTFRNSDLALNSARTLNAPAFTNIDNAQILISGGQHFSVAAISYAWTNGIAGATLFSADGIGSGLDLSSLGSFSAATSLIGGPYYYAVTASNGGVIDLSHVSSITGAVGDEWLQFRVTSGGNIDLSALATTINRVYFDPEVATFSLPTLQTANGAWLQVSTLNTINAPALTTLDNGTLDIADGGTVNAPLLRTFRNSDLALNSARTLNAPAFASIDNARIQISGGRQFVVAASSYSWTNSWGSTTLFSADGAGSRLDLSSLGSFSAATSITGGPYYYSVTASNGGTVDLSQLTTVRGALGDEWLRFAATGGGKVRFGSATSPENRWQLLADAPQSQVTVSGNLVVNSTAQLILTNVGELRVSGNFSFGNTTESSFSTAGGTVTLDGSGVHTFEVGGQDVGIPPGSLPNNFTWGQMVVGQLTQRTLLKLVDAVDNGNRIGGPEALYLQGFPGSDDGLRILGGSVLSLNGLNTYVTIGNQWTRLNDLFPPGINTIPFDGGYVARNDFCASGNGPDCNANSVMDYCEFDLASIYVNGSFVGCENGTQANPLNTVGEANATATPGDLVLVAPGSYPEIVTLGTNMTIETTGGTVRIGPP